MAIIARAPGRVCLFGDHQDYLGLPIIACAIDRYITISGEPNDKDYFEFILPDLKEDESVRFRESVRRPTQNSHLSNAIKVVKRYGCNPDKGYTITITGDIPINAGLSSSSAVVVAWVQWLLYTFNCDHEITQRFIGQLAYEAEVLENNSSGGKMDQFTSAIGGTIFLETDHASHHTSLTHEITGLIIGVSGVPKDTEGLLGDLKGNQQRVIDKVRKADSNFTIATATIDDFEVHKHMLSGDEQRFLYAAIKNHLITKEAYIRFRESVLSPTELGKLMTAHHTILKDFLKITVPRIDAMIAAALEAGAYGAKIVGSGGGGSICALAPEGKEQHIITAIKNAGAIDAYHARVSKGVTIL